jgi:hypothetical protein
MGADQPQQGKPDAMAKQQKADRLAQALRDNLHRRKSQARARNTGKAAAAPTVTNTAKQSRHD